MTRHKDGGDGEQVVGEFSGILWFCILTVNHLPSPSFFEDKLQQFAVISTQAVFVHDHNFLDHSSEYSFQKGFFFFAFEVETGSNV